MTPPLGKLQNIARPSRSLLEVIKESWIEENGSTPSGNADDASQVHLDGMNFSLR